MPYHELIKRFDHIREYLREFYLYGFRSRREYTLGSARSYDDERRRAESWLGDYMRFAQGAEGKNVFLSIDSRVSRHNPLYAAWKTKSFTDGDITLHFILLDLLCGPDVAMTLNEMLDGVDRYRDGFSDIRTFDESTVRKKLKEYEREGIVLREKRGKTVYYRRSGFAYSPDPDALDFFSETAPCGVIGSFLLDKQAPRRGCFAFKHHYITSAMDSEILCALFEAMGERRAVTLKTLLRGRVRSVERAVVPLRVRVSVQSGRQYLLAYALRAGRIISCRTDRILSVTPGEVCGDFDRLRDSLAELEKHLWLAGIPSRQNSAPARLSFTVRYGEEEKHIRARLEREKRIGTVEHLSDTCSRFSAEAADAGEVLQWVRTFIGRITAFECSDPGIEERFRQDLEEMYALYGLEGGGAE